MAGLLAADRRHPELGDLGIARAAPQWRTQVGLRPSEQAVADLAVGGQPDPVTGAAEGLRHGCDDADRVAGADHPEQLGRRAAAGERSLRILDQLDVLGEPLLISAAVTISSRCQPCWASSGICSMNRSWTRSAIAQSQQLGRLMIVDAAHQHGVDLDRLQAGRARSGDTGEHVGQPSPPAEPA